MAPNTLRSRQQQRRKNGGGDARLPGAQHLDFVADESFNPPRSGILRATGRLVKISARGNTSGMSATWLITDEYGMASIASLQEVVQTDFALIPPTIEQLESILSNLKFQE